MLGEEPPMGPDVVQILLRLPGGGRMQRRFLRTTSLAYALDWVESEPDAQVGAREFRIVQKWPGHCRELGQDEASETFASLGFARQEALFLQPLFEDTASSAHEEADLATSQGQPLRPASLQLPLSNSHETDPWSAAERQAHAMLDQRLEGRASTPTSAMAAEPELAELHGQELVGIFERLVQVCGMPPQEAATAAKKWAAQLRELGDMGFEDWPEAVRLLEKYNGRLQRVANLLAERMLSGENHGETLPPAVQLAPASNPVVNVPASTSFSATWGDDKERFKAEVAQKFKELIASGMEKNEAATQAIQLVRAAAAAPTNIPHSQPWLAPQTSDHVVSGPNYDEQLSELAAMGFVDTDRNAALLKKYAGRIERVIENLCSA